jgi:hypothetical protein
MQPEEQREAADLAGARSIQLLRSTLEKWHREPFFEDAVTGCLVRFAHGTYRNDAGAELPNYLVFRVKSIAERHPYRCD